MSTDEQSRRKAISEDHDILIEIKNDVKHLVQTVTEHVLLDDKRQEEIKKKLDFQQKIVYGGIGILGFIEFLSKLIR